jgi:hypothetical protein
MAGFEVTLYGRIWVTPKETDVSFLSYPFVVADVQFAILARAKFICGQVDGNKLPAMNGRIGYYYPEMAAIFPVVRIPKLNRQFVTAHSVENL